jgi:ABC-type antimicrobial peptide transport system permease subunit
LVERTLGQQALIARLTLLYGLTALAMVALGTYGVTAWSVQQRTREIGVRMALGANRANILALMSQDALRLLAAGVAFGLPLALAAGRLLGNRLFGIGSYNLGVIGNAVVALAVSAAFAVLLPATRAASVEPTVALRHD